MAILRKASEQHKYMVLRHWSGAKVAVNTGVINIKGNKSKQAEQITAFCSYYPCGINEYISLKGPFITPKELV